LHINVDVCHTLGTTFHIDQIDLLIHCWCSSS